MDSQRRSYRSSSKDIPYSNGSTGGGIRDLLSHSFYNRHHQFRAWRLVLVFSISNVIRRGCNALPGRLHYCEKSGYLDALVDQYPKYTTYGGFKSGSLVYPPMILLGW